MPKLSSARITKRGVNDLKPGNTIWVSQTQGLG